MTRKVLIALALVTLFGVVAQAHDDWPVSWVWAKKPGPTVPVKIDVVRWAEITFCDPNKAEILLKQIDGDTYAGCVCLKLCVNFVGLNIKAKYNETIDVRRPGAGGTNEVSLVLMGNLPKWERRCTTYTHETVQLSGNEASLELCVKITKVDPQRLSYEDGKVQEIGFVTLEMWPSNSPNPA